MTSDTDNITQPPSTRQVRERRLTLKQQRFIDAYLGPANGNASQAARDAGYHGSDAVIRYVGSRNLTKACIKAAIEQKQAESAAKSELTVQRVLDDLAWGLDEAKKKKDLVAYARFAELRGRYLAMFTDRSQVEDVRESTRLTREAAAEAKKIAHIRLHQLQDEPISQTG